MLEASDFYTWTTNYSTGPIFVLSVFGYVIVIYLVRGFFLQGFVLMAILNSLYATPSAKYFKVSNTMAVDFSITMAVDFSITMAVDFSITMAVDLLFVLSSLLSCKHLCRQSVSDLTNAGTLKRSSV